MLEISLLGEIAFRLPGKPPIQFRGQKEIALLAYLAHTGQTHNREALADLLWEARSTQQSLSNLRTTLARLRKHVGDRVVVTQKTVAISRAAHEQTDTVRFQAMMVGFGQERSVVAVNHLAQALKLYSGEFMSGFSLPNTPRFNDWLTVEQERLRQIAMRGYRQLAAWQEEQGAFGAGVVTAQTWVAWDPLDETAQQQLMRLLVYDGRAAEARAVFEKCRDLLRSELHIPPSPATIALYEAILAGSLSPPVISPPPLHNLPRALTPLFGRKHETTKLISYLLNPEYPLIAVTGVGGIGKTSLALAAARKLIADKHPFTDGVWFVSLEEIENDAPEKVRNEVAALVGQAMNLSFHGESDRWSQLLGHLASKNLLLILDNIEQFLIAASDLLVELLQAAGNVHILTTTRTTLPLAAGVAFPLVGLETPTRVSDAALENDSVRLFAERATRMPVPFELENHLAEVVAICQFVEGLPLAIELAAASLGRLLVDEILPALTSNLHLLDTTLRDLPPRQRTLHAVFDFTWQLLDPAEQSLLAQISVFRGGFTHQAAEAVLNSPTPRLYTLQYHALLNRDERGRYKMHPLLRQLAREKLSGPNMNEAAEQALHRHTLYFTGLVRSFETELQFGEAQEALEILLSEQANLRVAWRHAVQTEQWHTIADCLDSIHYFYRRKGVFSEEAALIEEAIKPLQATMADDRFLAGLLSRLLTVRAWDHLNLAQFDDGLNTAELACEMANRLEEPGVEAQARLVWARILSTQHKHEAALVHYEEVVALAQIAQNQILEAEGWLGIGRQILWQPDVKPAREPLLQALNLCQTLLYKPGEMQTLIRLGELAHRQEAFALSVA